MTQKKNDISLQKGPSGDEISFPKRELGQNNLGRYVGYSM
jgi:hypothetical protein